MIVGVVGLDESGLVMNPIKSSADGELLTKTKITQVSGSMNTFSNKLRYDDMNASTGGVARATSVLNSAWTRVYSYTGSGLMVGFLITLENSDSWQVRLVVDGEEILGANGILTDDLLGDQIYDMDTSGKAIPELDANFGLFMGTHDRFMCSMPIPIGFSTSVNIYLKRITGAASKRFRAGLAVIQKDT